LAVLTFSLAICHAARHGDDVSAASLTNQILRDARRAAGRANRGGDEP
jgi:hypothetical protein